jgi:hypothetical protein
MLECRLLKITSFFFQHLVWILGLKPSTGGSLKAGRTTADSNAVITTAVMADLPVLSAMLSRLFESSQYLDDVALHHLIDALCKLSHEAMELAYSNRVRGIKCLCVELIPRFGSYIVTYVVSYLTSYATFTLQMCLYCLG